MPVLTTHPIRDQLLSLLGEQRSDEFLLRSEAYLDVVEQDHEIRLRTVQEYLKRGLLDPARDHLNSALVYTSAPSDMADLRPQLMQLPRGVRPWRLYTDRFEANLSSLDARGIDTSSIRDAWRSRSGQFELHVDSANTEYVRWRRDKGWSWIPFFGNHRLIDQNRPLPEDIKSTQPGPYAFDGLDLGYYFERIYEATTDTFLGYSGPIFVVEPDPAQLAMLFHMHDWTKLLADRRVHLYFGTDCMHQFFRSIDSTPTSLYLGLLFESATSDRLARLHFPKPSSKLARKWSAGSSNLSLKSRPGTPTAMLAIGPIASRRHSRGTGARFAFLQR